MKGVILMNISGKTCVVTGASSGLGLAATKQFARLGANVVLVCRDQKKGGNAVTEIQREASNASVELMICDLASIESIRNFIEKFKANHSKLDILFNNAAVMKMQRTITEDGFETMFQTNYLAPFIITMSFLDLLKNSSPAQVINIAVSSHKLRLDFNDLQSSNHYGAWDSFFKTKLCLLLFSIELSRRIDSSGITVVITAPGSFKSNLVREARWPIGQIKNLFSGTVDKAAKNIVFLASSYEDHSRNGKIYLRKQEQTIIPYWNDSSISKRLWSITESLVGCIS